MITDPVAFAWSTNLNGIGVVQLLEMNKAGIDDEVFLLHI